MKNDLIRRTKLLPLLLLLSNRLPLTFNSDHSRAFLRVLNPRENKYAQFSANDKLELREMVREMFHFGYESYVKYAFPLDELDPMHCVGRGPDYDNPDNININDALGDYSLTLIDTLDTLAIMGNYSEFARAVSFAVDYVSFERDSTVQVFEATIRVLGGLLSAHMIISDPTILGNFSIPGYRDELLMMAHDLASRLMPAFQKTATGIPFPRVNLKHGVPRLTVNSTCTAGAGSLLLEFGALSRLLDEPEFEAVARRTNRALWKARDDSTGLFGNVIDIQTGEWVGKLSGVGAGLDSYYEYLLKAYIMFGEREDYIMFNQSYAKIKQHMRRG